MKLLADLKVANADSAFVFLGDYHGFIAPDDFQEHIWRPIVEAAGMREHDFTISGIVPTPRSCRLLASRVSYLPFGAEFGSWLTSGSRHNSVSSPYWHEAGKGED
jgi:hypothetical protein